MKQHSNSSNCENMDHGDVFLGEGVHSLEERLKKFAVLMRPISKRRISLYRRTICSPADKEVTIFDPMLSDSRKIPVFGPNYYIALATHPLVGKRVVVAAFRHGEWK